MMLDLTVPLVSGSILTLWSPCPEGEPFVRSKLVSYLGELVQLRIDQYGCRVVRLLKFKLDPAGIGCTFEFGILGPAPVVELGENASLRPPSGALVATG